MTEQSTAIDLGSYLWLKYNCIWETLASRGGSKWRQFASAIKLFDCLHSFPTKMRLIDWCCVQHLARGRKQGDMKLSEHACRNSSTFREECLEQAVWSTELLLIRLLAKYNHRVAMEMKHMQLKQIGINSCILKIIIKIVHIDGMCSVYDSCIHTFQSLPMTSL